MSKSTLSKSVQTPLNACKFLVMGIFIAAALCSPLWNRDNFSAEHSSPPGSILTTGLTIFMSYQGFELMAAIRRPFRSPKCTLPLAMALCLSIVTLYYCSVAYCTVGNVNYATAAQESSYLLSAVAQRFMGEGGSLLLCTGAVIASASAMNADVFSVSEIPEEMAEEHEMPTYFLPSHRQARTLGVLFLCSLLVLFVNLLSVQELTAISSLGFLGIYTLANAVSLKITRRTRTSTALSAIGAIVCATSGIIVAQALFSGPDSKLLIALTISMLMLPFIWQAVYYRAKQHRLF